MSPMLRSNRLLVVALVFMLTGVAIVLQAVDGPLTNALNLRVKTDGNGYLLATGGAYSGVDGPYTSFGNIRLRTDQNGYLLVAMAGAQSISVNGIAATSTDGLVLQNTTPATVGVPVQQGPRLTLCGTAWKTDATTASQVDCMALEARPISAAGATTVNMVWMKSINGGAYGDMMNLASGTGQLTNTGGSISAATYLIAGTALAPTTAARTLISTTADKLLQVTDNGGTTGIELNMGTPTLGTCTGGAVVAGSHNFGGQITGNTSGTCAVTFGTPNFSQTPFCQATDGTGARALFITAASTSTFTVNGLTSGDSFTYFCAGRIGV